MKRFLQWLGKAFPCINGTVLAVQAWAALWLAASWAIPAMQKLTCPYLRATGRECLLCGYTRMSIAWLRDGSPINRALMCFLVCWFLQLGIRMANACWMLGGRKPGGKHALLDLAALVAMVLFCLGMFCRERL